MTVEYSLYQFRVLALSGKSINLMATRSELSKIGEVLQKSQQSHQN